MGLLALAYKIKWIIIIIIVILAIIVIMRWFRLKPEIEEMLRKESRIARTVFSARDILHSASSSESSEKPPKKHKVKAENIQEEVEENDEDTSEEHFVERIKVQKGNRKKPRRKNSKVSKYKREEICRKILEDHFDDYFPTVRPKFLTNPKTGRPLELDGYNSRLNLAFEHQGHQHYKWPNRFHKTEQEYLDQLERDVIKLNRCKELGIDLITIHEDVPQDQIDAFIKLELRKIGK